MLAYLFWHRPAEGVEREAYERVAERFHRSLAHSPPAGLRGSGLYQTQAPPWLPGEGTVYEDWYLVEDFTALGVLNEAAVARGHRGAHDEVAHRVGSGAGALYALREGRVQDGRARRSDPSFGADADGAEEPVQAIWIARPLGAHHPELAELLGDGMDPERASLWRRALVLGPAPEYCLLASQPPPGVAATRLPEGWTATVCAREAIWRG